MVLKGPQALHLLKRFMCINYVSVTRTHIIHQQSLINSLTHWCSSRIIFTVVYLNVSDYAGLSEICFPKQARRGGRSRRPDDATASTSASVCKTTISQLIYWRIYKPSWWTKFLMSSFRARIDSAGEWWAARRHWQVWS